MGGDWEAKQPVNQFDLIPDLRTAANGDVPRDHPRLILPSLLKNAVIKFRLPPDKEAEAHSIIVKWAEMERSARLGRMNEKHLEAEFLTEVFGQVLGYTLWSENLPQWELWPHFGVNGGEADAAIGRFRQGARETPRALIELKGPKVNVDRDRFNGRTAVDQCFDYLIAVPECPWGIVCNYASFRLYHRNKTKKVFEHFTLEQLADKSLEHFREFLVLFGRDGLLPASRSQRPHADRLLEESAEEQRKIGDDLYIYYAEQREELIGLLMRPPHNKPLDVAIRIAQKLIDRIIFVAFCEDRGLVPSNRIEKAWKELPGFTKVTNPRWQNFLALFHFMDVGNPDEGIPPFDGGLFRRDPEVDDLNLTDDRTTFFKTIGTYDFRDAVNVDVLGHLFERSINDIERLRRGGLFGELRPPEAKMEKSAERKRGGIYYTPREFTRLIVQQTVRQVIEARLDAVGRKHGAVREEVQFPQKPDERLAAYWKDCFEALRGIKVCDPACGSGAFLIEAYEVFDDEYRSCLGQRLYHEGRAGDPLEEEIPPIILRDNLYGADLSREAVEITQLALWLRSARPDKTLADISENIVCGNSLVADPAVDPRALDWRQRFADVFSREEGGFDCVIGNPPWERLKLQEREFFDATAPDIAAAVSAATRRKLIEELQKKKPELYARYVEAKEAAERALGHVRTCGNFPLTAAGDINTYAVFAELARTLVAPEGRVGLLVPSGIATDHTTRHFFAELVDSQSLMALYDFENRMKVFPDVDGRFKFSVLLFGGSQVKARSADFVFFAHQMADLDDANRHVGLSPEDLKLLNPNSRTCPIFRSRRDAEITKAIYRRVPVLVNESRKKGGNPWGVRFVRMFDQTNDAELFHTAEQLKKIGFKPSGAVWKKGKEKFLPLYEAKMVQAYDHRAAGVVVDEKNWMRQGQTEATTLVEHQNPEFAAISRWWVAEEEVVRVLEKPRPSGFIGFKDITSATNQRTMIAAAIPWAAVTNHFPLILAQASPRLEMCLLANLNSLAYDYAARQKIGAVTLNFFIVEQLPTLPPDRYAARCPWDKRQTLEKWISDRVLALTCTANDMIPLAKAAGLDPPVHKWKEDERAELMAELDAAYFILYGLSREDAEYILSTFQGAGRTDAGLLDGQTAAQRVLEEYDRLRDRSRA